MNQSIAKCERSGIAETLLKVGPASATLCADWTSFDLLIHLILRENRPDAAFGQNIPFLKENALKLKSAIIRNGFEKAVADFANGPKLPSFFALPGVDSAANTFEFVVHHEDLLRAQPNYQVRELPRQQLETLWKWFTKAAPLYFRKAKMGLVLESELGTYTIKKGKECITLKGSVIDLILYAFGRKSVANIEFSGEPILIEQIKSLNFKV